MKTINKLSKLFALSILLIVASCQQEVDETITSDQEESFKANSAPANLLVNVSSRDGSVDNIVDKASCLTIKLPFTVIVNDEEVTVETEEDYETIEALLEEFTDDDDEIEIQFPITVILPDFTEIVVEDDDELEDLVDECDGEDLDDLDIECIDVQYPVTFQLFDSDNNLLETVVVENDRQLFRLLENLGDNVFVKVEFPVTLILADDSTIEVNSIRELVAAIESAEDDCDEDDDNDINDDDNNQLTEEEFRNLLVECPWEIDKYRRGNDSDNDRFEDLIVTFGEDGSIEAMSDDNDEVLLGTYEISSDDNGLVILIEMETLTDINDRWRLHVVAGGDSDEVKVDLRRGRDRLRLEQECDDDDDDNEVEVEEVNEALADCFWRGVPNSSDDFNQYEFYFNDNAELVILHTTNDDVVNGTWEITINDQGVVVNIDANEPLDIFDGSWLITNFDDERIEFVDGDNTLVLEQECEDDEQQELCYEDSREITICDNDDNPNDGFTTVEFGEFCDNERYSYFLTEDDAENNTNALGEAFTNTSNPQTIFVSYDVPNTSNREIHSLTIEVKNCNAEANLDLRVAPGSITDTNANGIIDAGDEVMFTYTVTNNGELQVNDIVLNDPAVGVFDVAFNPNDLMPGASSSLTHIYALTPGDLDAGRLKNQATVIGDVVNDQGDIIDEVRDLSDDPTNSTNVDFDNDGDFEDETFTDLPNEGIVSGTVFVDANSNGVKDDDEEGIADVDVIITSANSNTQTVLTNDDGFWSVAVVSGDTNIDVDDTTLPDGASLTTTGSDPETVKVRAGMSINSQDDGYNFR